MKNKMCPICKKKFITIYKHQKYCSINCSQQNRKNDKKRYYITYSKKHSEQIKKYRDEHKEIRKKYINEYRYNPRGIYCELKHGAKIRKIDINFSKEEFINWYNSQEQICHYCNRTWLQIEKSNDTNQRGRLTIDRKDNNKGYELNNIILACNRCNTIKSNYFTEEEMLEVGKIIKNRGN